MSDQQDSAQASGSSAAASSSSSVNVQQVKSQVANRLQANKPLVLKLHSILTWEQDFYPIIVVAFVSIAFLLVYLLNSSVLTTFSYLGMVAALADLAMPMIAKNLAQSQSKPAERDQQRFDKLCLDLAKAYALLRSFCDSACALKTKKPKIYYPALLGSLLVFAYIGNKFNNLFLTYLVTMLLALYPGLDKRGVPQRAVEFVYLKLGRRPPSFASSGAGDRRASNKRN